MAREVVRSSGEDPARRALEHIAGSDNGIDHEVRLSRSSTSASFSWRDRSVSFERNHEEAVIRPSEANGRQNACGNCGGLGHNVRTCTQ